MALTQDRGNRLHQQVLSAFRFPVAASTRIYLGALVTFDASGNLVPASDSATFANKAVFMALESIDNTGGTAGAKSCLCLTHGTILVPSAASNAVTDARRGMSVHVVNDGEVATTSTNSITFGRVLDVSTDGVHIAI